MKSGGIAGLVALLVLAAVVAPHSALAAFVVFLLGGAALLWFVLRRVSTSERLYRQEEAVRCAVALENAL